MKAIVWLILVLSFLGQESRLKAQRLPESIIRVGLLQNINSVNISGEGDYQILDLSSWRRARANSRNNYLVKARSGMIHFGREKFGRQIRLQSLKAERYLRVNGRRYRGTLMLAAVGDQLIVINELGLEGYLYGVLPREVSAEWPLESLKAQAVVSRTFALKSLGKHSSSGFDVSADVWSQVYGGFDSEKPRTNLAVNETRNQVIVYKNALINSVFFSTCGGHTEDPQDAWQTGASQPFLRGVRCSACRDYPHFFWAKKISEQQLLSVLQKLGIRGTNIRSLRIATRSRSGRAKILEITTDRQRERIWTSQFRVAVGPDILRSTFINEIIPRRSDYEFRGRGWGHGVGFCQWGAKGMAERYDYKRIVEFYYPGTRVETWED